MDPDHLAAMPLPIFLAESVYNHPLPELLPLIIELPLSFLRYLQQLLLDVTVNEDWDAGQNDVEVVLVLEDLLDEAAESDRVPRFVRGVRDLRLVHQEGKETIPELVVRGQESDEKSSTNPYKRILSIFE